MLSLNPLTRRSFLALATSTALAAPPATAGEMPGLAALLKSRFAARYGGKPGGLTLLALTPRGEFFASTLEDVTTGSHFRGASTTKTFTAAAIMLLDQRGLLKIDDTLTAKMPGRDQPYMPNTPGFDIPHKEKITIRQLLGHHAGVFDIANQPIPAALPLPYSGMGYLDYVGRKDARHSFTKDELIGVVAAAQVSNGPPGDAYHYSDTHYTILGKIVEQVAGMPLDQFKQRELLKRNALDDTRFVVDGHETTLPPPAIHGFSLEKGEVTPADDYNYSYDPGSGNVATTPADLARWIRLLVRGEAGISSAQVARMCDVAPDSHYGLGISRKASGSTDLGFGHSGGTAGFLTSLSYNPDTDTGFVLVCSLIDFDDLGGELGWLDATAAESLALIAQG
jgi:D-alanyl-D-alanine carboxypeptidase